MAFQKWHASQMRLHNDLQPQTAAKLIADGLVGPKPEDKNGQDDWFRRRNNIRTHTTRGKKWNQLVEQLGRGILFKSAW